MDNIDIIVPWVNPKDPNWIKLNNKYSNCKGDNSKQRTRDLDIFKYFFRSIDTNCKWVRKVHLILQSETQIPDWLNIKNDKLNIIYHNQYIPKEYLPTFNTFVIEGFIHKIADLSENFILCNDDYLFTNMTSEEDFFRNNLPVDNNKITKYITSNPIHDKIYNGKGFSFFQHILKTNQKLEKIITGKAPIYYNFHVTCQLKKSLIIETWDKYGELLSNALKDSKFRREKNFNAWLYRYIQLDKNLYINSPTIINDFSYKELGRSTLEEIMHDILTKKCICLNDAVNDSNEIQIKTYIHKILNAKFPNKSSFEN